MPYKDPEKNKAAIAAFHKNAYYPPVSFKFRKDRDKSVYDALNFAAEKTGEPVAVYVRNAAIQRLIREGYLESEK